MKIIIIKKKYLKIILPVLVLVLLLGISRRMRGPRVTSVFFPVADKIIALDPGHGGIDPGKVGRSGVKESDINLKIALKLKKLLEESGAIVIMTRSQDEGLYGLESKSLREMKREDLVERKRIAEEGGAQLFISIHQNSFSQSKYRGAQTFYKNGSLEGERLAHIIQKDLREILDKENSRQPQKTDDIFLLNEISLTSVLIESGFLSNMEEEALLQNKDYQERIAWAIFIGILNYYTVVP